MDDFSFAEKLFKLPHLLIYIGKVLTSIDSQQYPPFRTLTRLRCSLALSTTCLAVDILYPSLDKSPLSLRVLSLNR